MGVFEPEPQYQGSFKHNINDTSARYKRRKEIDVTLSDFR